MRATRVGRKNLGDVDKLEKKGLIRGCKTEIFFLAYIKIQHISDLSMNGVRSHSHALTHTPVFI